MGFDYFKGMNWKNISRDERRFCADLVFQLETNNTQKDFIKWIIEKNTLTDSETKTLIEINESTEFEIDFEVCFYRDLIFEYELINEVYLENKIDIKGFLKRTFDICIFLPNDIIIIEAKAAQGLTSKQMTEFKYDKEAIKICFKNLNLPLANVHVIGLVSAEYTLKNTHKLNEENNYFDGIISWKDIESNIDLKYKQPVKLKTVYSETSNRNNYNSEKRCVINDLKILTAEMNVDLDKLKRKNKETN